MAQATIASFFILVVLEIGAALPHCADSTSYASGQNAVKVERLDPAANDIIPNGATLRRLATGFGWTEGPIWIHDGSLLFADISSNSIRKLSPPDTVTIYLQPSGYKGTTAYGGPEPGSNGRRLTDAGA